MNRRELFQAAVTAGATTLALGVPAYADHTVRKAENRAATEVTLGLYVRMSLSDLALAGGSPGRWDEQRIAAAMAMYDLEAAAARKDFLAALRRPLNHPISIENGHTQVVKDRMERV